MVRRSFCNKMVAFAAVLLFVAHPLQVCPAEAGTGAAPQASPGTASAGASLPGYLAYLQENAAPVYSGEAIKVPAGLYDKNESTAVTGAQALHGTEAVMTGADGRIVWTVEAPADGLYRLSVCYYPVEGYGGAIERSLLVDGAVPFKEARYLKFYRVWADETGTAPFEQDTRGNEIRPTQVETPRWVEHTVYDATGYIEKPLTVRLTKGTHSLALESVKEPMAIAWIALEPAAETPGYATYRAQNAGKAAAQNAYIDIPAEHAAEKSDLSLYAVTDRTSPVTQPQDPSRVRLNSIGGTKWQNVGQKLTWNFHVDKTGCYQITLRFKKDVVSGMFSTRRILIDGELPFAELNNVRFNYQGGWQLMTLGGGEEAYSFYLEQGDHSISMEVVLGDMAALLGRAQDCLTELNTIYRDILMITGTSPDKYRDYKFKKVIPGTLERMAAVKRELESIAADLVAVVGKKGEGTGLLDQLIFQLEQMIEKPEDKITANFSMFKSNISSMGSWLVSASNQPLQLDYIAVHTADKSPGKADSGFFSRVWFEIRAFAASFFNDYDMVGDLTQGKDTLLVWVATGRDQASVLKQMIDDNFTPLTGVPVNLQLVAAGSLLPSTLAGVGPDVALDNAATVPVDYGLRGAVLELSSMEGFDEVKTRFHDSAWVPYTFDGKTYGVPQTQSFSLLFYRTDILEQLELEVPATWEELYAMIPVIQNNNMEIGFPVGGTTGTLLFLYQNGGELYRDGGAKVNLDSDMGLAAFQKTCELFTKHTFPVNYDFANRFKTGEMPMGIADYTVYNQLEVFAPEIKGMWSFSLVPGTARAAEGGTEIVDHSIGAAGTSTVIMSSCKNPADAWDFVKWWTGAEAQSRYAREIESILGPSGKYATANTEAFRRISTWTSAESQTILEQWDWAVGTPEVPGGYYTSRGIEFAYARVYNQGDNPVESMLEYIDEINQELARKRKEFHIAG